jgi:site-specific recombinase XerD
MNKKLTCNLFFSRTKSFLDDYLMQQANKSHKTVKSYRDGLTIFKRYICEEKGFSVSNYKFSDCTYEFVLEYITYLRKIKMYEPSSINQRLAIIKSYLRYAADCDISIIQIFINIQNVPFVSVPKRQRPIIEFEALKALFNAPKNNKFGIRDRIILILLFDTAIRLSELLSIKLSDININNEISYIRILGKGNKERVVSLNSRTIQHLEVYLKVYHLYKSDLAKPLIYTTIKGVVNPMSERNVERIVKKYSDVIREEFPDLPPSVFPHMLRRTRATGMYRDDVALELIARILGHSSLETTRIYALPSIEMLSKAMEATILNRKNEVALWKDKEEELNNLCGLR